MTSLMSNLNQELICVMISENLKVGISVGKCDVGQSL